MVRVWVRETRFHATGVGFTLIGETRGAEGQVQLLKTPGGKGPMDFRRNIADLLKRFGSDRVLRCGPSQ